MRVAITGGTGFVGGHLARRLVAEGHDVVLVARGEDRRDSSTAALRGVTLARASVLDEGALRGAFEGCDAVAHCAGINREIGAQTYERVHVVGTRNVVAAAEAAGVRRLALASFLRARPECGSGYHESKFAAEEIVRASSLEWTVLRAGMMYGRGDHMLDHLSHLFHTWPLLATVGLAERAVRPLAVADATRILFAALVDGRLPRRTVAAVGPDELTLAESVRRVARVVGRPAWIFPMPVAFHTAFAWLLEATMTVPLVARAQVRILSEGVVSPALRCDPLPEDLVPDTPFTDEGIRVGLPAPGRFGLSDLRCCAA